MKIPSLLENSPSEYKIEPFFLLSEESAAQSSIAETSTPATSSLDITFVEKNPELRKAPSPVSKISAHHPLSKKSDVL